MNSYWMHTYTCLHTHTLPHTTQPLAVWVRVMSLTVMIRPPVVSPQRVLYCGGNEPAQKNDWARTRKQSIPSVTICPSFSHSSSSFLSLNCFSFFLSWSLTNCLSSLLSFLFSFTGYSLGIFQDLDVLETNSSRLCLQCFFSQRYTTVFFSPWQQWTAFYYLFFINFIINLYLDDFVRHVSPFKAVDTALKPKIPRVALE